MAADGTDRRRLTADPASDSDPAVSPDGRYIVFGSSRSGHVDLWRMNNDGTNPVQLTHGTRARVSQVTRDGKWVVFTSAAAGLWRVPPEGGPAQQISSRIVETPALSSDGQFIACYYRDRSTAPAALSILPIVGGDPVRSHGFEILHRFQEQGKSAKTTDRSELQNLLKYCRTHKGRVHFVIVYNLTRFAREKYDHFALRAHLKSLGISLRSATEPIDDTSILPGRNRVRRKSLQSNRRNGTTFQLLGAVREC